MPEKTPPSATSFFEMIGAASSGDPEMLGRVAGVLAAFCARVLVALLILAVTLWAAKRVSRAVGAGIQRAQRNHSADKTLADFIATMVKYVIIAIGLVAVLQQLGVQATSVLAVLGAASLAIGLALQGTLSNVAAGVMILLLRPYRLGDRVELNGRQGIVAGLDLFNTKLTDYAGQLLYLPNGKVFGDMIVNTTQSGRKRIDLTFGIGYDDDMDLALKLLIETAAADDRVMQEPAPWSKVTALADSAVNVTLRCWATPEEAVDVRFDIVKRVKETFDANGLSFPYPHQVSIEHKEAPAVAAA